MTAHDQLRPLPVDVLDGPVHLLHRVFPHPATIVQDPVDRGRAQTRLRLDLSDPVPVPHAGPA